MPGQELSIDGLLTAGDLTVTAVFDKPGMPDGPTFEETLLVTPSRLAGDARRGGPHRRGAARALGLSTGPIHAELRICDRGRARSCSSWPRAPSAACAPARCGSPAAPAWRRSILANALACRPAATPPLPPPGRPCGVLMLPVPRPGVLRAVEGRAEALAVPGITGLTITIPLGQPVRPLPDGDRYLGFVFASGDTPADVEQALTAASGRLRVIISDDRPDCRPSS